MNKTLLSVGAVSVVALVLSGVAYFRPPTLIEKETVREVVKELGAFPGPEISSPYLSVNGITTWYNKTPFVIGTSTPCAILSPAATSSLISWGVNQQTATSAAVTWTIATSTAIQATTTPLYRKEWAANNLFSVSQTGSTTAAGQQSQVIGPSQYLVVQGRVSLAGIGGGGAQLSASNVNTMRGYCTAVFQEL